MVAKDRALHRCAKAIGFTSLEICIAGELWAAWRLGRILIGYSASNQAFCKMRKISIFGPHCIIRPQIACRDGAKRKKLNLVNLSVTTRCDKVDTLRVKIGATR